MMKKLIALLFILFAGTSQACVGPGCGPTPLIDGSTAVTQIPYDVSTSVATDAFAQTAVAYSDITASMNVANIVGGVMSDIVACTSLPTVTVTVSGSALATAVPSGGTGCAVGDTLGVGAGGLGSGIVMITAVSSGVPTTMAVLSGGTGYSAGSGLPLNAGTATYANVVLTGVLGGNLTIVADGNGGAELGSKRWRIANNTTGAFTVTICQGTVAETCSGGRTVVAAQGTNGSTALYVQFDGSGNIDQVIGVMNASGIVGTTTNDSASAGRLGEVLSATLATGSSVSLTTNTTANVTSVSLTAGDWDCSGDVDYTFGATTSYTQLAFGISTTSATLGAQDTFGQFTTPAAVPTATFDQVWPVPTVRISLASTTTTYLVTKANFTVSTLKAYGTIRCRRER